MQMDSTAVLRNGSNFSKNDKKIQVKRKRQTKLQVGELSEYEKRVQKNKEERMAFLSSLGISEIKDSISEAVRNLQPRRKVREKITHLPRDKSKRLAKMEAMKSEENEPKKLLPTLPFADALAANYLYENFSNDFNSFKHENAKPFNRYVSHFENMHASMYQVSELVNKSFTSLAIHPMSEKIIVFAGSSNGEIVFWNVNSAYRRYYIFEPHLDCVTNLKFCPDYSNQIVSSSSDGTLRCGDLVKHVFQEVYSTSDDVGCTDFDFLSPYQLLVALENGDVSLVDYRTRTNTTEKRHKCHEYYSVNTVSVHPLKKSYFISAESNGIFSLWDLRKFQKPVIKVQHHTQSVVSAFFSPLTGKSILTTSDDDTICLFDSSNLGESLPVKRQLKHKILSNLKTSFRPLRSTWLPSTEDTFAVGSIQTQKSVEIFNDEMENIFSFKHSKMTREISSNIFHPSLPVLAATGGHDGRVFVYTDRTVSSAK